MIRFSQLVSTAVAGLMLSACNGPAASATAGAQDPVAHTVDLRILVERYWAEQAALMPWYSWGSADGSVGDAPEELIAPQALADSLTLERRYLVELQAIQPATLNAEAQLTYAIFRRECELAIEGATYPAELLALNPYDGMPERFALMEAAAERLAPSSSRAYENWRSRTEGLVRWMNQAVVNLHGGLRRGYTVPRLLVEKSLPQLAALGADTDQNPFYAAIQSAGADPERLRLTAAMRQEIKERVLPSYRAMHDFLQHEYLPRSRTTVGLSMLPLGDAWYAYLAKRYTGGAQTPAQLHAQGVAEMERLHQRLQALLGDAGGQTAQTFYEHMRSDPRYSYKSADELMTAYQELKVQVDAAVPALFPAAPRGEFSIRRVESYRADTAPALSYRPRAPNGLSAAVLYVNTARLEAHPATPMTAEFLSEAEPGHHYQFELQRERADLPRLRRFAGTAAFVQGWGLYAASLGEDLGLYRDTEARFGALLQQMNCAAGMVADTGLHALGWSRGQAVDYVRAQVPTDEAAAEDLVDRAIARPGAALACGAGYLKIQSLRQFAQQGLGSRFELRAFHEQVLKDGAMPLSALEVKIKRWIDTGGAPPGGSPPVTPPATATPPPTPQPVQAN
jgi:uncharacterized protein (DUF885 family)